MIGMFRAGTRLFIQVTDALSHLVLLGIRLWMGNIFIQSGWNKFQDILNGNMQNVVDLFEYVHPVPYIPADIAAPLATGGELVLGGLLVLGLLGRFAAAGLLVMTIVIQISMPQLDTHVLWGLLFAVIMTRGSGIISVDGLYMKLFAKNRKKVD